MGCCCKSQGEVKAMTSIAKNRGCTDLLMLILYILTMTSVPYLMREATFAGADPWRMLRGYDLWGRSCGHAGVPPLAMLPNPIYPSFVVCVNDCSETWEEGTEIMAIRYPSQEIGTYCVPAPWKLAEVNGQVGGNASFFDPVEFLDEIPGAEVGETMLQDIYTARDLYGLVVVVALALSFLWLVLLGKCAKCLFYVSVLLVLVLITGIGITMFALGKEHLDLAEATGQGDLRNKAYVELGLGGFILFVCFIVLLLLCVLRKRINIALAVIKEASRALRNMMCLLSVPLITVTFTLLWLVLWIACAFYMYSVASPVEVTTPESVRALFPMSFPERYLQLAAETQANQTSNGLDFSDPSTLNSLVPDPKSILTSGLSGNEYISPIYNSLPPNCTQFERNEYWQRALWWHLFILFWNINFINFFAFLLFAGAAADWYFSKDKSGVCGARRVVASFFRTFFHHIGTVAFAALVIAIVQLIRAIVEYIQRTVTGIKNKRLEKIKKAIFCCIKCCLWLVEKILRKISKNALIWTAIHGTSFCSSVIGSWKLLFKNVARMAVMSFVGSVMLSLTKIACALSSAAVMLVIIRTVEPFKSSLVSPVAPGVLMFLISYLICTKFVQVFGAIIDTIFLCFLVDDDVNGKGQMMGSAELQKLVGKFDKEAEKNKEKHTKLELQTASPKVAPEPDATKSESNDATQDEKNVASKASAPAPEEKEVDLKSASPPEEKKDAAETPQNALEGSKEQPLVKKGTLPPLNDAPAVVDSKKAKKSKKSKKSKKHNSHKTKS